MIKLYIWEKCSTNKKLFKYTALCRFLNLINDHEVNDMNNPVKLGQWNYDKILTVETVKA